MKRFFRLIVCFTFIFSVSFYNLSPIKAYAAGDTLLPAQTTVAEGEKWGFINTKGEFVISPEYVSLSEFNENGIAIAAKGSNDYSICSIYFIDKSGKTVSGPYNAYIPQFYNGLAVLNGNLGASWVVDSWGKLLFKSTYELSDFDKNLVAFGQKAKDGSILYGFMDLQGKVVAQPIYKNMEDYRAKITKSTDVSSSMIPFSEEKSYKYGYKIGSNIVLKPIYTSAEAFDNGVAIVSVLVGEYSSKFGLINQKGEYVLKPEYSSMQNLGQGLYSAGKSPGMIYNDWSQKKAIFDSTGKKLSDFIYYNVSRFNGDYASASDETTTFFIDKNGNIVKDLPILKGIGTMTIKGDVIKAELDEGLQYSAMDGSIIWQKDESVSLGNGLFARAIKYRRDFFTFVKYPQLEGLADETVQSSINNQLKSIFISQYEKPKSTSNEEDYAEDIQVGFTVQKNLNLLIVEQNGYDFPLGAAHGQPYRQYYYFDLQTGKSYELKDLFKNGSNYINKLTALVKQKLDIEVRINKLIGIDDFYYSEPTVYDEQCYIIGEDSIKFIYQPYEIAPYAAGYRDIEISYGQMSDILNTNGSFYKAFSKKSEKNKLYTISFDYDESSIGTSIVNTLSSLVGSYENKIIEAVNTDNFSKVSPYLLKDSSLYNSQLKLVQNLYKKSTKEKLVSYEIAGIGYENEKKQYKIFVTEVVAIQYPGKAYVNKSYNWCYTAKLDTKTNSYMLCNIEKW